MKRIEYRVEKILDEFLRESFKKKNTLLHQIRGEIIELEYKGDQQVIQDILDDQEARILALETELNLKETEFITLQTQFDSLSERLYNLEPKEIE